MAESHVTKCVRDNKRGSYCGAKISKQWKRSFYESCSDIRFEDFLGASLNASVQLYSGHVIDLRVSKLTARE